MDISAELQNHISLKERTRKHVKIYFQKTQDAEIKRMLPSTVQTEEEALKAFKKHKDQMQPVLEGRFIMTKHI